MTKRIRSGAVIAGRYEVRELAGKGGMGVVYSAMDLTEGRLVALKLLGDDLPLVAEERLAREAIVLAELRHPRIVGYIDHGELPDGQPFLIMEWIDGHDLSTPLDRGPLSIADTLSLLRQAADALAEAHRRGVIHRDIKPSNIFLRGGRFDSIVLLDFGVARRAFGTPSTTAAGALVGTPEYMAPEQARAQGEVGPSVDVFSLGCVLYQCLTGRSPFPSEYFAALLAKIVFQESTPVEELRRNVPPALAALVHRMLSKDPALRPKDAIALMEEIAMLPAIAAEGEPSSPSPDSLAPPTLTGDEQALVSVVMAVARDASARAGRELPKVPWLDELASSGARVERLRDGSIVLVQSPTRESAADLVTMAARSALFVHERWPEARVALATGRGVLRAHGVVGEAIDRAASLLRAPSGPIDDGPAAPVGVLLDDTSAGLLSGHFEILRGAGLELLLGERVSLDDTRPLLGKPTPCVGRELELGPLEGLFSSAIEEPAARAALITADAGMGKSRVRHELVRRLSEAHPTLRVLVGRGDPLSCGSAYGIIIQALRRRFGVHRGVPLDEQRRQILGALPPQLSNPDKARVGEHLSDLIGLPLSDDGITALRAARMDPKVMSDELRRALLDWLRAECLEGPVLLVLEDMQWGDLLTIKLVDAAMRELSDQPLLVLALARPEVVDIFRRPWGWLSQEISLRPLSKRASERLIREVLGDALSAEEIARIFAQSEGNALYLEELIRAAAERQGGSPETLLVMLHARLARLDPGVRKVLRAASIFGEMFTGRGARELLGGSSEDVAGHLAALVDAEIIEPRREGPAACDDEHRFRHDLLREAAYRLLTNEDRARGHALASAFLERVGEADPMVIAEHAQRGGDLARAASFYLRAAEQSWDRNDLDGIRARVQRALACGLESEALGIARALECQAHRGKGDLPSAASAGLDALDLLPPGSLWWCRTMAKLFFLGPHTGQPERLAGLAQRFLQTQPSPEARAEYAIAAVSTATMLALTGARVEANAFLTQVEAAGVREALERDPIVNGTAQVYRAWVAHAIERDPYLAVSIAEDGAAALARTNLAYCMARSTLVLGVTQVDIGDRAAGEATLRRSLDLAKQANEPFFVISAWIYLAMMLSELSDPGALEEAESLARAVLESKSSTMYLGGARIIVARALRVRGQGAAALDEVQKAYEMLTPLKAYWLFGASELVSVLLERRLVAEARAVADDGVRTLGAIGGGGFSEIPMRLAFAEARLASDDMDIGRAAVRDVLSHIERRAIKIPGRDARERFVTGRPENDRALTIAGERFGVERAAWLDRILSG